MSRLESSSHGRSRLQTVFRAKSEQIPNSEQIQGKFRANSGPAPKPLYSLVNKSPWLADNREHIGFGGEADHARNLAVSFKQWGDNFWAGTSAWISARTSRGRPAQKLLCLGCFSVLVIYATPPEESHLPCHGHRLLMPLEPYLYTPLWPNTPHWQAVGGEGSRAESPCFWTSSDHYYTILKDRVQDTPLTLTPQQKISNTLKFFQNSLHILNVYIWQYLKFTFGAIAFTFGETMFTFRETTYYKVYFQGKKVCSMGLSKILGFLEFHFCCWDGFGTLCVGGSCRGFRKEVTHKWFRCLPSGSFLYEPQMELH